MSAASVPPLKSKPMEPSGEDGKGAMAAPSASVPFKNTVRSHSHAHPHPQNLDAVQEEESTTSISPPSFPTPVASPQVNGNNDGDDTSSLNAPSATPSTASPHPRPRIMVSVNSNPRGYISKTSPYVSPSPTDNQASLSPHQPSSGGGPRHRVSYSVSSPNDFQRELMAHHHQQAQQSSQPGSANGENGHSPLTRSRTSSVGSDGEVLPSSTNLPGRSMSVHTSPGSAMSSTTPLSQPDLGLTYSLISPDSTNSPYPPQFFADFDGGLGSTYGDPHDYGDSDDYTHVTSHPMGSFTPAVGSRGLINLGSRASFTSIGVSSNIPTAASSTTNANASRRASGHRFSMIQSSSTSISPRANNNSSKPPLLHQKVAHQHSLVGTSADTISDAPVFSRRKSKAKAASGGPEQLPQPSSGALHHPALNRSNTDRAMHLNLLLEDDLLRRGPVPSAVQAGHAVILRTLSLSTIPSPVLHRWATIVRTKVLPKIRHQVVRNQFLNRMTARLANEQNDSALGGGASGVGGGKGLDVWSLVGSENGLAQFRSRVKTRLSNPNMSEAAKTDATEEIMTNMFKSLQTFHHLMNIQQKMNADLSKGEALKNILFTVYGLLDCEQVTLFLVDESRTNLKIAWTHSAYEPSSSANERPQSSPTSAYTSHGGGHGHTASMSSLSSLHAAHSLNNGASGGLKKHMSSVILKEKVRGLVGHVGRTGEVVHINDVERDPRFNPAIDRLTGRKTKSMVCVPISVWNAGGKFLEEGRIVAVIEAINKRNSHVTPPTTSSSSSLTSSPQTNAPSSASASPNSVVSPSESSPIANGTPASTASSSLPPLTRTTSTPTHNSTPQRTAAPSQWTGEFTEEDVSLLKFIGLLAGTTIENHTLFEETLLRKRQQEALSRMIELMSSETNINAVMQHIISCAYELIQGGVDRINLFLVDEAKQIITCKVSKDQSAIGQKLPLTYGILGTCASERVSINIQDTKNDPRYDRTLDRIHGYHCHNILTLPILDKNGHVAAIIQCTNKKTGPFTKEDEELLMSLSRSAGEILRKAQLFESLLVEQRKTRALLSLCQADESSNSVDELAEKILDIAEDAVKSQLIAVCFVDKQSGDLMCVAAAFEAVEEHSLNGKGPQRSYVRRGSSVGRIGVKGSSVLSKNNSPSTEGSNLPRPHLKRLTLRLTTGIPSHVANTGLPLNLPSNSVKDEHFDAIFDKTFNITSSSTLCLPMKSATTNTTFAVLLAINKFNTQSGAVEAFSDEDEEILTALCQQSGSSVRRRLTEFLLERSRRNQDRQVDSMLSMYGTTRNVGPSPSPSNASSSNMPSPSMAGMSLQHSPSYSRKPSKEPHWWETRTPERDVDYWMEKGAAAAAGGGGSGSGSEPNTATHHSTLSSVSSAAMAAARMRASSPRPPPSPRGAMMPELAAAAASPPTVSQLLVVPPRRSGSMIKWNGMLDQVLRANKERRAKEAALKIVTQAATQAATAAAATPPLHPSAAAPPQQQAATQPPTPAQITIPAQPVEPLSPGSLPLPLTAPHPRLAHSASAGLQNSHHQRHVSAIVTSPRSPFSVTVNGAGSAQQFPMQDHGQMSLAVAFSHHSPALRAFNPRRTSNAGHTNSPHGLPTMTSSGLMNSAPGGGPPVWGRVQSDIGSLGTRQMHFPPPSWSAFPPEALAVPPREPISAKETTVPKGGSAVCSPRTSIIENISQLPLSSAEAQVAMTTSPLLRPLAKLLSNGSSGSETGSATYSRYPSDRKNSSPQPTSSYLSTSGMQPPRSGSNSISPTKSPSSESPTHQMSSSPPNESQHFHDEMQPLEEYPNDGSTIVMRSNSGESTIDPDEAAFQMLIGVWPEYLLNPSVYANLPSQPTPFSVKFNVHELQTLEFNCWNFSEEELLLASYALFQDSGLINEFELQPSTLQTFLLNVRARYRQNPYHSWYHGFSVLQCGYFILKQTKASTFLSRVEQLGLLISCLCHDIDHPGTTNSFQMNCASELAIAHNDQSILEHHHAYTLFSLLRDPELNILDPSRTKLTQEHNRLLRKVMILAILHTDMAHHFETCKKLDLLEPDTLQSSSDDDRQFMINLITHASDLSGQVYPLHVASIWEARVSEEFSQQAELETQLGLPVAPFMQNLGIPSIRYKNHCGFLNFVMYPLWRGLADLFPNLNQCIENLQHTQLHFNQLLGEETLKLEAEALATAATAAASTPPSTATTATKPNVLRESSRTSTKTNSTNDRTSDSEDDSDETSSSSSSDSDEDEATADGIDQPDQTSQPC